MNASPYDIRRLPLRQQIRDRYRLLLFPGMICVAGLISWLVRLATGGPRPCFHWWVPAQGCCPRYGSAPLRECAWAAPATVRE